MAELTTKCETVPSLSIVFVMYMGDSFEDAAHGKSDGRIWEMQSDSYVGISLNTVV
jgi:hypothetical protein